MFEVGLIALDILISFILICFSAFAGVWFWKFFKRNAKFEVKIKAKDYRKEIIEEKIKAMEKEIKFLKKIREK